MGLIYKITSPSGKIYVGQTKNLKKRLKDYKWRNNKRKNLINSSIKKYGWDAHKFEIIDEVDNSILSEREIFWIKELNSFYLDNELGLNMTRGGEGGQISWMHDLERRRKMSEARRGVNGTFYGKKHTEECKAYLGKVAKERNLKNGTTVPKWGAEIGRQKVIRAVIVYNNLGKFVGEFESITDCANHFNYKIASISDSVRWGSWVDGQFKCFYKTDSYPMTIEVDEIKVKTEKRAVLYINGDVIKEYESSKEASEELGVPKTTINRAAYYNNMKPIRSGHVFIYKDLYNKLPIRTLNISVPA